ncbi:nicotinate-nucleotide-dimethylbenzimidazole phosphoribosyltransferase /cob(II)yrinic acid a,c-diamide reductase [Streptomyces sp. Ag109_O5-1]|uniref:nicotinate-nucleotide--dimethylbenzimidazole phosphoribosyltransferase n=1 Tax=Streptomyces sp. Ag109_O5-1 TaxID=1938851 RepID=UPI000F4DC223|nr:nicotinate-nucleotide--dimethylbenzimidazole phosphoribosyltransferase [Streptomyces sp. Ag109_O5-1]RPE45314.1 nicotinate-nucleotide-dimethylbenzimidazole phosphoribosyltransferase /cob(II)yrinic acid a,c-diamide reductase [Streptomyces sp. Ag109_O5-1]
MTDTGQVPGEGLPESAGMVEQPGVPAHGAYTYLSESPAEDEELLLPGAQGAWGNEVPPPAPEPVVETVHEPGPHEMAGRDSGSVDLTGVRLPSSVPASPILSVPHDPAVAPAPRRPLHLGPPIPDASTSPVRSLADRGPAGAPVRQPGQPAAGPEYLDAQPLREAVPQPAAPWGAPQGAPQAVPVAQVSAPAPAAETVAPVLEAVASAPSVAAGAPAVPAPEPAVIQQVRTAEPSGAAQAAVARLATEAGAPGTADAVGVVGVAGVAVEQQVPVAGAQPEHVYGPVGAAQPAAGDAPVPVAEPAAPQVVEAVVTPEAAPVAEVPQAPQALEAVQVTDAGVAHDEVVVPAEDVPVVVVAAAQAVPDAEAGQVAEAVVAETVVEAAVAEPEQPVAPEPQPVAPEPQPVPPVAPEPQVGEPVVAEQVVEAVVPEPVPAPETEAEVEAVVPEESVPAPEAVVTEPGQPVVVVPPAPVPAAEATVAEEPAPFPEAPQSPEPLAATAPEAEQSVPLAPDAVAPEAPAEFPAAAAVPQAEPAPEAPEAPSAPLVEVPPAGPQTQGTASVPEPAAAPEPLAAAVPSEPTPDQPLGEFVAIDGQVPTTPHLAPTPPHPLVLPAQDQGEPAPEQAATVPAPREAEPGSVAEPHPDVVQQAEDLETRAAEQEESTAPVAEVRQSTGPAAPAYDDAEREAVLKVMRERRDIRNGFRSDPIPHEVLLRVLEAAHTAPSVGHSQPWDFVVIRSADTRRSMHELAMRQRDAYAKSLPKGRAKQFKELKIEAILDTPVNIVVTADPTRGGRHTLGRHTQPQMAPYSAALAVENLWLAARAEGLGVGWVSFFDEREMVRALGLPEHLEVIAYLCVGYVDEFPDEPELMQAGWSKRRPLSWVVHEETYGRRALPGEDPHDLLAETVAGIRPLDAKALGEAWERQKRMTKPAGALGMLEIISAQLSGLSRQCPPPIPEPAAVAIFAGDHGVHAQGVTPWPQEVTAQMVANFLGGGAVCNAFAGQVGAEVCVVDVGVASELPATPGLLPRKVRAGTSDMTTGAAMTREEAKQAIEVGIETARDLVAAGNKALLTGEMGIANTTASAALISVFTGADPSEVTGRGTGINDETLARKTEVVRRALELHQPDPADPIGVLAAVGGFEHAAIVGLLLGGASLRTPVILDGVSAGAAALVARAIAPEVLAACIAGHRSAEPGHVAALNKLGLRPLVDLDLRLGEGTGALLALPLVQSTARAMHEVATFDSAGVTEK